MATPDRIDAILSRVLRPIPLPYVPPPKPIKVKAPKAPKVAKPRAPHKPRTPKVKEPMP